MKLSLLLVGSGKMGQAMLGGWIDKGIRPADIVVVDPGPENLAIAARLGCQAVATVDDIPKAFRPDVLVLAVKPQVILDVLPTYRAFAAAGSLIISIAAGTRLATFEAAFGADAAIIRTMPNTPAAVHQGMMVSCANASVSPAQRGICDQLMQAIGEVAWVEDEALMDAVTGLSGSGPAYVFYMIECMAEAGVKAGLPEALAVQLAQQTVAGAGALARQSSDSAAQLRVNVTSPNGTTAAGLAVLMDEKSGLAPLMEKTVAAATERSKELG
ncbi:MAG: pyrroline-5-carboxylate reductase [Sneathiella sp.]|jgi:pyrroline-5-carboxylate reductase|uniref:pyrroline-5-carboxylate reductase n=1 Tax=Sneathiella sp. TaxID=1964365 RepID=UPI000C64AEEC|nr:pyrroline-5-carboxylate reductase [Sneathiella sp.]MAL80368.1 pyrroline-5-carboxylate reductase [Sneathiella sp.]